MHYWAVFYPNAGGGYVARFPDLPEVVAQGDTVEACFDDADAMLAVAVEEYAKARKEAPQPSTLEQVKAFAAVEMQEFAATIDQDREPVFQLYDAPAVDLTPVKVTLSVARSVLDTIDAKAKRRGMTRSRFLTTCALQA